MDKTLRERGIAAIEYIGGDFARMAVYTTDGRLKITDYPDFVPGQGWPPAQEVVLRSWEEIVRLRDFLNSLQPVAAPVEQQEEEATYLERATA
ncbi:hypothetical protein G3578_07595 [Brevibacillus sp. SYP-B805]|uniref:hypothetical protein n=1 Tax=Brevibacillus sp. SYP-B805 TaxID=1578199 RepID=UPI0013ED5DD6|nr:hypothetical protein [Brevibacillus sp. SYP-B805]NGQ95047.1 hypothetical protein [Brevibacillus sp. SYP-B805]